jgi:hypothetical protein
VGLVAGCRVQIVASPEEEYGRRQNEKQRNNPDLVSPFHTERP